MAGILDDVNPAIQVACARRDPDLVQCGKHVLLDPVDVCFLGTRRVMANANGTSDLVQQLGRTRHG